MPRYVYSAKNFTLLLQIETLNGKLRAYVSECKTENKKAVRKKITKD